MSLMNRFSMSYNMEKANKKKDQNLDATVKMHLNIEKNKEFLSEDIVKPLLNFGYSIDQIMTAFKIYKFTTVDDAILILMRDPETGKYHHRFISMTKKNQEGYEGVKGNNSCLICGERIVDHIDYELDHFESKEMKLEVGMHKREMEEEAKDTTVQIDKTNQNLKTSLNISGAIETRLNSDRKAHLSIKQVEIPKETMELFDDPEVCRICFSEVLNETNKTQFACGHSFCKNCVINHLTININNGKVSTNF